DILKEMPDEKEKVETQRENLKRLRVAKLFDDIERAHKAGQYQWVREQTARFPQQAADPKVLAQLTTLQTQLETADTNLAHARRFLRELAVGDDENVDHKVLADAAAAIQTELNADTVPRLEAFVSLAQQAVRDREQNRT